MWEKEQENLWALNSLGVVEKASVFSPVSCMHIMEAMKAVLV